MSGGFVVIRQGTAVLDSVASVDGHVSNGGLATAGSTFLILGDSTQNVAYRPR